MFVQDFIINSGGQLSGQGAVGEVLASNRFDPGMLRPFFDSDPSSPTRGQRCVIVNSGKFKYDHKRGIEVPVKVQVPIANLEARGIHSPVFNATSLRKEEWLHLDQMVLRAARYRLRAWADLASASTYGGFNGMSKMVLEHETMSDPGEALVDMDGLTEGRGDAPKFQLEGLPLPITHSDFWFSSRRLAVSRNTGTPLDATMGEAAGRRVAERIEKMTIGNGAAGITYGGNSTQVGGYGRTSKVYGYTDFPSRLTKTNMTAPTATGWTPETLQREFNACLNYLRTHKFYGPFMVYNSTDWDQYLDGDYYVSTTSGAVAPSKTLRERLRAIDGVQDIRRLDFLFGSLTDATSGAALSTYGPGLEDIASANPYTFIFVQMTSDVVRAVVGMDITTVQWESKGGMQLNFKVMCINVPQIRADFYGNCGILHATTS